MRDDFNTCFKVIATHQPDLVTSIIFGNRTNSALIILTAFHAELASQARAGSAAVSSGVESSSIIIRLQWWRTVIDALINGNKDIPPHPVARMLSYSVRELNVDPSRLISPITARQDIVEHMNEPFATVADMHAYSEATYGAVLAASVAARFPEDKSALECAKHVARAMGVVRIFQRFPTLIQRGILEIPTDIQVQHKLTADNALDNTNQTSSAALVASVKQLCSIAHEEINNARNIFQSVDPVAKPSFIMAVMFERFLHMISRYQYNLVAPEVILSVRQGGGVGFEPIKSFFALAYHLFKGTI